MLNPQNFGLVKKKIILFLTSFYFEIYPPQLVIFQFIKLLSELKYYQLFYKRIF